MAERRPTTRSSDPRGAGSVAILSLILVATLAAAGCVATGAQSAARAGSPTPAPAGSTAPADGSALPDQAASDAWWYWFAVGGLWSRSYESLEGLVTGADAVVLGRIVEAGPGRVEGAISPDGWDDRVFYTYARVSVERVIAGRLASREIVIQLLSPDPATFADRLRAFPKEPAIFFVTDLYRSLTEDFGNSPGPELDQVRGIYEWTIPGAVVRDIAGVARPLLQLTAAPYLVSLDGRPFDEVVATVARLAK